MEAWARKNKKLPAILMSVVAIVIAVSSVVYYELSYNSENGTHPELVTSYRSLNAFTATFYVTVHAWSWADSLDTHVISPSFSLTANNLPFGTQAATSETFSSNNYVTYTLTFSTADRRIARHIRGSNTTYVAIQMSADVDAGWYQELITRSDSPTWRFG
jgi:hypothetical protein